MHAFTVSAILAFASVGLAAPSPQPDFTPVDHAPPTPQTNYQLVVCITLRQFRSRSATGLQELPSNAQPQYRGENNLHCNNAGPYGYHYNVTVFNPEPYAQYSACKNLYNPARAFQIGVKPTDDQLTTSRYMLQNGGLGNYRRPQIAFWSEPNCRGHVLGYIPKGSSRDFLYGPFDPPGPSNSTYGTCYESDQLARSAELLITTANAAG